MDHNKTWGKTHTVRGSGVLEKDQALDNFLSPAIYTINCSMNNFYYLNQRENIFQATEKNLPFDSFSKQINNVKSHFSGTNIALGATTPVNGNAPPYLDF